MKYFLPLEAPWWAEFRSLFRMSKSIILMQPPNIHFLRYHEKCFTFGSVFMSRIQKTFQNVEVYYFYATAIYLFSNILCKIRYLLKRNDEQNSEHFSECRRILFLCSRRILIFQNIMERRLPLEASLWAEFRTLFRMSKCIIFIHRQILIC